MAKKSISDELAAWLTRLAEGQPKASVIAFNIELAEMSRGFLAYLIGADAFDDTGDWACRPTYRAKEQFLFRKSAYPAWETALQLVCDAVRAFLATEAGQASFLGQAHAVTVGFGDGDLERIR